MWGNPIERPSFQWPRDQVKCLASEGLLAERNIVGKYEKK